MKAAETLGLVRFVACFYFRKNPRDALTRDESAVASQLGPLGVGQQGGRIEQGLEKQARRNK